jgi:DNA-binding NtrC family response regulator
VEIIKMVRSLYPAAPVLLVDDEAQFLASAVFILKGAGINNVVTCSDSRRVMSLLEAQAFSVVLLDLSMPHIAGIDLLPEILARFPGTPVIIISAANDTETEVRCLGQGALAYLLKPLHGDSLIAVVKQAAGQASTEQ